MVVPLCWGQSIWLIFYLERKIGNHGLANYFPLDLWVCFKVTHCESCLVLHLVIWLYGEEWRTADGGEGVELEAAQRNVKEGSRCVTSALARREWEMGKGHDFTFPQVIPAVSLFPQTLALVLGHFCPILGLAFLEIITCSSRPWYTEHHPFQIITRMLRGMPHLHLKITSATEESRNEHCPGPQEREELKWNMTHGLRVGIGASSRNLIASPSSSPFLCELIPASV